MQHSKILFNTYFIPFIFISFAQQKGPIEKLKWNVIENTKQPLEYATVTIINSKSKVVAGGITNQKRV
jgi:hypothetical protein